MKERPILFSGKMVQAILEGRKTQTRRIVKPQPHPCNHDSWPDKQDPEWRCDEDGWYCGVCGNGVRLDYRRRVGVSNIKCPYGQPGDRLWVRETWQHADYPFGPYTPDCPVFYRADYLDDPLGADLERSPDGIRRKWNPSIHMPKAASRILLEIVSVRIERLQMISAADALREGVSVQPQMPPVPESPIACFINLWNSINGTGAWEVNPWVWVVEFKRVTQEVA